MIAACPKCQTRYRVEPGKLGADGARLRCSQCGAVFRVRLPAASPPVDPVTPGARALASDAAVLGGVARSEAKSSQPSEDHRTHVTSGIATRIGPRTQIAGDPTGTANRRAGPPTSTTLASSSSPTPTPTPASVSQKRWSARDSRSSWRTTASRRS